VITLDEEITQRTKNEGKRQREEGERVGGTVPNRKTIITCGATCPMCADNMHPICKKKQYKY
jgi:hypothetical protein